MPPQQPMPPSYGQQPYGAPPQGVGQMPYQQPLPPPRKKGFNSLIIPLVLVSLLLVTAIGFGVWAFMERDTYKNKTNQVVTKAVEIAQQQTSDTKDKEFIEKEKNPLKTYTGPAAYGSVSVQYPKTWSAYVDESAKGSTPVDGYFHPDFVPGLQAGKQFALRIKVVNQSYDQEVKRYEAQIKTGKLKAAPFTPGKVASNTGIRMDGELEQGVQGVIVILPLRDKTLEIFTETKDFVNDFNTIILPSLTFIP